MPGCTGLAKERERNTGYGGISVNIHHVNWATICYVDNWRKSEARQFIEKPFILLILPFIVDRILQYVICIQWMLKPK